MPAPLLAGLLYEFSLGGVNRSIPGNGGQDCVDYLPNWQKIVETVVFVPLCVYVILQSIEYLERPEEKTVKNGLAKNVERKEQLVRALERVNVCDLTLPVRSHFFNVYAGIFFIEFIYKTITRNGIFFLNPCHICSLLQLLLLKLPIDDPRTTQVFRFQMYTMPGAILALLFPILNTRLLVGECLIYFVQHIFIVLTPLYLMTLEHAFIPEPASNLAWPLFGMASIILYHYLVLQPVAILTHVNLNVILCPSLTDPFAGRFYRVCAVCHQCLIVPLVTKLYGFSSQYLALVIQLCTQKPKSE